MYRGGFRFQVSGRGWFQVVVGSRSRTVEGDIVVVENWDRLLEIAYSLHFERFWGLSGYG